MLEFEILGHVHVRVDGRPIEDLPNPRLLVYLLLHRGRPLAREQVAYDLWPDSNDAQALTNLRRELHVLRRALPAAAEFVPGGRRAVEWPDDGSYVLDVAAFEKATESDGPDDPARLGQGIALYRGDLAPAIYDDWIAAERERLRARYRDALERLVDALDRRREYRAALEPARRLVALDPLDETGYRAQIRLATRLGDRAVGLRAYEACVEALRRELDVDPSPETRLVYQRLLAGGERAGDSYEVPPVAAQTLPLVGREAELGALIAVGEEVQRGGPRLVVVHGEPGIGKTRLIEEAVRRWTAAGRTAATTRSYAAEGSLAYAPVAAWLRSAALQRGMTALEPVWLSELARLAPELLSGRRDVETPAPMTEGWQRQRLFEALGHCMRAAQLPLLLVLDDAHWSDPDTLEWVHYLLRFDPLVPVLVLLGARVEEERSNRALAALLLDTRAAGLVREISLRPLGEEATRRLASSVAGEPIDEQAAMRLFHDTAGHPLFVVEMLRSGLRKEDVQPTDAAAEMPPAAAASRMPPRIRAVIAARLERLPAESRRLAESATTIGRDFSLEDVAEASDLDERGVAHAIDDLWQRQIIRELSAGSYDFAHVWIRDVAGSLIPPGRRQLLHRRVARALERNHAGDLDQVAGRLAAHYEAAGMIAQAIDFHERAARLEARLSAYGKALAHLDRALDLLGQQPRSAARDRRELALQMARSAPLNATLGYPAKQLEATLLRSLELAEAVDGRTEAILALNGLFGVHFVRGSMRRAAEYAQAALDRVDGDASFLSNAWMAVGGTLTSLGEIDRGIAGFTTAMATFDPETSRPNIFGLDPAVFCGAWSAHALWLKGRWQSARARAAAAVDRAESLQHPFLQALAHAYSAILCQLDGDELQMLAHAQEAQALCARHRFPYYGEWGAILEAWSERGRRSDSAARIEAALERLSSIGAESRWPYYLHLLADSHLVQGRTDAARAVLDAAVTTASANDDRWWLPEVYRAIGVIDRAGLPFLERAFHLSLEQRSYALAVRAGVEIARLYPERAADVAVSIAGIADGLEDTAATAPLETLAPVP